MYYMCYEGVWFMGSSPNGPWTVTSKVPGEIYEIPISSPAHNVTYVTVEDDDDEVGHLRDRGDVHGGDGRVGLRRLGQRLVLPAVLRRLLRRLPVLPSLLPDLRLPRLLQPLDGRLQPRRGGLRPLRRRRRRRALQPADRDLFARRRGLRTLWLARRGPGLQPAHRHLRPGAPGLERVRELGRHVRAARRPVGADGAGHEQPHRHDHARHPYRQRRRRRSRGAGPAPTRAPSRTGGGDVYAGRDGNVYRKQGGSWQKYDNGNWGSADRPTPQAGTRERAPPPGPWRDPPPPPATVRRCRARPRREATSPWTSSIGIPAPARKARNARATTEATSAAGEPQQLRARIARAAREAVVACAEEEVDVVDEGAPAPVGCFA